LFTLIYTILVTLQVLSAKAAQQIVILKCFEVLIWGLLVSYFMVLRLAGSCPLPE
jgi:hypothetical protein